MFKTSPDPRVGSPTGTIIFGAGFVLFGLYSIFIDPHGEGAVTHLPSPVIGVILLICGAILIVGGIRNRSKV